MKGLCLGRRLGVVALPRCLSTSESRRVREAIHQYSVRSRPRVCLHTYLGLFLAGGGRPSYKHEADQVDCTPAKAAFIMQMIGRRVAGRLSRDTSLQAVVLAPVSAVVGCYQPSVFQLYVPNARSHAYP